MKSYPFKQVDVFSAQPLLGNPLAVVLGADDWTDEQMATFARWTNLSESAFLLAPQDLRADYRVRIFTTQHELPFAGHPTLGACHAWLEAGGRAAGEEIIQECGIGLVRVRRSADGLAFSAPPLIRQGALDEGLRQRVMGGLGLSEAQVIDAQWIDNGAGWLGVWLRDRTTVLALTPDMLALQGLAVGVFAAFDRSHDGAEADFEVRAFVAGDGMTEDPATGSLNAGIARWLLEQGHVESPYRVSQGTAIGRAGRLSVEQVGADIWIGGQALTCVEGKVSV